MPLFFIHGVNVRKDDETYEIDAARRTKLFRDVALESLAIHGHQLADMEVHDIYWGDLGVRFAWKLASVPKVKSIDAFGPADTAAQTDAVLVESVTLIADARVVDAGTGHKPPVANTVLQSAARHDPVRFAETLLLPLLTDFQLVGDDAKEEGELQAILARAAAEAAADPQVQRAMAATISDDELIAVLTKAVDARFRALAKADAGTSATEAYGSNVVTEARLRFNELFSRVLHAPARAASLPVLQAFRPSFHRRFSRFLGDIFVYLQRRGDTTNPGPIVKRVLADLQAVKPKHEAEPVIVVTHSMGGNILYDVLTTFAPKLRVDVWISVGGQVALFEEMKLFLASDSKVSLPDKLQGIKTHVKYWANIYDPADSFSFLVDPVFHGVDADVAFSTGASLLKSHGEYFGLASFHRLMREHIKNGLNLP